MVNKTLLIFDAFFPMIRFTTQMHILFCLHDCFKSMLTWSYLLKIQSKEHAAKPSLQGMFNFIFLIKSCTACGFGRSMSIKDNVSIVYTSVFMFLLQVLFCKSKYIIRMCYA
jgi:hypothetical protein